MEIKKRNRTFHPNNPFILVFQELRLIRMERLLAVSWEAEDRKTLNQESINFLASVVTQRTVYL